MPASALRTASRVAHQLAEVQPGRQVVVLLLSGEDDEPLLGPSSAGGVLMAWKHAGQGPLEATLRGAQAFGAKAAVLVSGAAGADDTRPDSAWRLLSTVLDDGADLAVPFYALNRFEGVVTTGIAAPLPAGALRQAPAPAAREELALSRRLAVHLLGEAWAADPAHAGERPVAGAGARSAGEFEPAAGATSASDLPAVGGERRPGAAPGAAWWARSSTDAPARARLAARQGLPAGAELRRPGGGDPPKRRPAAGRALHRGLPARLPELGRLWGQVLPPQTLRSPSSASPGRPRRPSPSTTRLWARIVYDFAVGYHLAAIDRALLLRSMTPLYLAWVAGFVREVRELAPARRSRPGSSDSAAPSSSAKPYLISRWRWPDRFNP